MALRCGEMRSEWETAWPAAPQTTTSQTNEQNIYENNNKNFAVVYAV